MGYIKIKSFYVRKESMKKRENIWSGKYLQAIHLIRSQYPKYARNSNNTQSGEKIGISQKKMNK